MKIWTDYVFGGTKALQTMVAAWLIFWAYMGLPSFAQESNFFIFVSAELACAGIYFFFRNRHHQMIKNNHRVIDPCETHGYDGLEK